jgi:hypothetical protein
MNNYNIKVICIEDCEKYNITDKPYKIYKGEFFYTRNYGNYEIMPLSDGYSWIGFFERKCFLTETEYREQRISKILENN